MHNINDKIRLILDHTGNTLKNPKYGYITNIIDCSKVEDGVFCENGMKKEGVAYLIQTSWSSGMLWYSDAAFIHAGGKHELNQWKDQLAKYHAQTGT